MTATIKIYKDCKILQSKNFVVDDIADYLSSIVNVITISNFQYQKNALELNINIARSESNLEYLASNNFNYLEVLNENGKKVYYFIKRKVWRAKETIALELEMDVLNTLKYGTDYTLTDKTLIKRTHKNRFKKSNPHGYLIPHDFGDDFTGEDVCDWLWDGETLVFQSFDSMYPIPAGVDGIEMYYLDENNQPRNYNGINVDIPNNPTGFGSGGTCAYLYIGRENNLIKLVGENVEGDEIFTTYIDFNTQFSIYYELNEDWDKEDLSTGLISGDYPYALSYFIMGYMKTLTDKYAIIDLQSEGINPPLYKNQTEVQTLKESESNLDWYLIYKNKNDPSDSLVNPVEAYVCASKNIQVLFPAQEKLTADDLSAGTYYYLLYEGNGAVGFSINEGEFTGSVNNGAGLRYSKDGTKIKIEMVALMGSPNNPPLYIDLGASVGHNFDNIQFYGDSFIIRYGTNANDSYNTIISYPYTLYRGSEPTIKAIRSIDNLDRTSAKLIKVIKLPYAPFTIVEDSGDLFTFDLNQYGYDASTGFIKVNNFGTKFKNEIKSNIENPLNALNMGDFDPYLSDDKSIDREVKLLHSDYYQPKFYYDSFSFTYNLEKVNLDSYINDTDRNLFKFDFYPTTTMNSRFLFTFKQYITKYGTQDYDNIMIVTRNNEEVIYNVPYVNYMRTGYNYDVKNKNRQLNNSIVKMTVGGIASFVGLASGNPLAIMGAVAYASSIYSTINSNIQNEENIERKREEALNQGASVMGSDDIDLLSIYAENKVKFAIYQPSEVIKKLLFDLFYYTGYIANYQGIPDVTSRKWFNFLLCVPDYINLANISDEILNKLTTKFNEGVTFLHKNTISGVYTWQFEQTKENWESNLFV